MSPVSKIRKLVWGCSCLACHLLNLVLAALAVGQGGLLLLNFVQREIPLPDQLAESVVNRVGPEYLSTEWENAVFDLRAGILLSRASLRNVATEQVIATAREIHLQWSPFHLLLPRLFPIRSLEARDVEIYIPVSHSPSGLNEPILFIRHAAMREEEGELRISSLMVETGNIRLHFSGSAPVHILRLQPSGKGGSRFYEVLQSLGRLPTDLQAFADISWNLFPSGIHLFRVSGLIPSLDYAQASFRSLQGEGRIRLASDGLSLLDLSLEGTLALTEDIPELPLIEKLMTLDPVPFSLSAGGALRETGPVNLPSRIHFNLHPQEGKLPFDHLLLRTSYWGEIAPVHWIASSPSAFSSGWAHPLDKDLAESSVFPFKLDFRGYLLQPRLAELIPELPSHRLLDGAAAHQLQLNASFDPLSRSLQGTLSADGLHIGQTDFARLHTSLLLDPQEIHLTDIQVRQPPNQFASGSYRHTFATSKFSLNATGSTFPTTLDIILGDWWTRIFRNIGANEPLPADVTVWGYWRDLKSLQSVTTVDGNNGSYRGVPIPRLQLRVRSNHQWAVLEQLKASFAQGSFNGWIAIRSGLAENQVFRAMLLDLESEAPWEALCAASGIEELCQASFEKPPHVNVRGILWQDSGKGYKARPQADLHLGLVQHEGTALVQGLELQGLTLSGRLQGGRLDLNGLTGRFADGTFTGNISIEDWQSNNRQRHYDLQLVDAHFGSAREQLSESFGYNPNVSETLSAEIYEGRMDAVIDLSTGSEKGQARGHGSIALRQANLGQIHLFGGLSRVFTSMGLSFSSLKLDALTFDWFLADRILNINNGLVTGPSLRLQLAGSLNLESQWLAMQADVQLVKGMMGMVLYPVSENLQFDLQGPLTNPDWTIRFSPFKWLEASPDPRRTPTGL